jgi:RNA polymerase primary sigma factor
MVTATRDVEAEVDLREPDAPENLPEVQVEERPQVEFDDSPPQVIALTYLHEISRYPLLTAEEEIELSYEYERGREAIRRIEEEQLSTQQRRALQSVADIGERARRRLIESNLRLVVSVAKKYLRSGLPFLDLVQEGNIGLFRAVDRYNPRRGCRFSTYAYWWIRQAINRAITTQSRAIRLPFHVAESLGDVFRTYDELEQTLCREPTAEEVAAATGINAKTVQQVFGVIRTPISLDAMTGEDGRTFGETLADANAPTLHEITDQRLLRDQVDQWLQELSPREQRVLTMRFGLNGERSCTLQEVGAALGLSRERVRQIEQEALAKLREPAMME